MHESSHPDSPLQLQGSHRLLQAEPYTPPPYSGSHRLLQAEPYTPPPYSVRSVSAQLMNPPNERLITPRSPNTHNHRARTGCCRRSRTRRPPTAAATASCRPRPTRLPPTAYVRCPACMHRPPCMANNIPGPPQHTYTQQQGSHRFLQDAYTPPPYSGSHRLLEAAEPVAPAAIADSYQAKTDAVKSLEARSQSSVRRYLRRGD